MSERGLGASGDNPRVAERAALMTRAGKRDIDRDELRDAWAKQAADLGFDARALVVDAAGNSAVPVREAAAEPASGPDRAGEMAAPALDDIGNMERPGAPTANAASREGEPATDKGQAGERGSVAEASPASPAAEAVAWTIGGIAPNARPSSPAPISSPRRRPMHRARSPSRRPIARSRRWRRPEPCTPCTSPSPRTRSRPRRPSPRNGRPSPPCARARAAEPRRCVAGSSRDSSTRGR